MSVLERTVSMTKTGMSMVESTSVDGGAFVVVIVAVVVGGGGVEGLWAKKDTSDIESRAEDDAGAPRTPGRGGRGGLVALAGSGSEELNAETVNEG